MTQELEYLHPEDYFYTFDLGLACALVTLEYRLHAMHRGSASRAEFVFKRSKSIDADVKRYWDKKLIADLRTYFDNLKMLKSRLYSD